MIDYTKLRDDLIEDEGYCTHPYTDTVGKLSIGIGRNLTDRGLMESEVEFLFENDCKIVERELYHFLPWNLNQPPSVRRALFNLCFNLGITKLLKFVNTLGCIKQGNYEDAIKNLKRSKWFTQVQKSRSERIFRLLREGKNA